MHITTWPYYSAACRKEIYELLKKGGSLSAYRANRKVGVGPKEGSEAWKLEREVESKFNVKHAIAVNSGTAALHASLNAIGVSGKEVITTPYSFSATASAILLAGGIPRFADVDPYTFCISKETVKRVVTKKTAAILPVSIFGYYPDYSGLYEFGVPVIIDHCQAVGSSRGGSHFDYPSAAMVYSFNGTKNVPCGEGGAVVCNDGKFAEKVRLFINHQENFGLKEVSPNYRIQEVVALIARHGLKDLDERNRRRRDLANAALFGQHGDFAPKWFDYGPEHVFYCTPFKVASNRERFIKRMKKRGFTIGAGYITPPLHHYPAFRKYAKRELPVVDELSFKTLCLIYDLTPDKPLSYARKYATAIKESLS